MASNAFFVYLRDPDGHRVELYTSDYLTVDPDFEPIRWDINDARRQQLWGGIAPQCWFSEGSSMEAFEGGWMRMKNRNCAACPLTSAERITFAGLNSSFFSGRWPHII